MITGVTGQDGSYLAELLLEKGYRVVGLKRRTSLINTDRIDHLLDNSNFFLEYYDLNDSGCLYRIINEYQPDEFYNLAAQSHVKVSFEMPEYTTNTIVNGTLRILETIRNVKPDIRFYQASSSVVGKTKVLIRKSGTVTLEEIESLVKDGSSKTYYKDLECLTVTDSYEVKWSPVEYVFKHYSNDLYKLRGSGGLEIEITGNHSVIIMNSRGDLIEKKVSDLKKEDFLISFTKENKGGTNPVFDVEKYSYNKKYISRSNETINKIKINKDLMRVIGFYVSEGNLYIKDGKSYKTTFTFHIKEKYYTDDIKKVMWDNFRIRCTEEEIPERNTRKLNISSKQFAYFLKEHFKTGSHNKIIPSWMYELPYESYIEFMRGYIGDANIRTNAIVYTSCNKNLIENICYLSKLNGLDGSIVRRHNKEHLSKQKTIIEGSYAYDLKFSSKCADEIMNFSRDRKGYKTQQKYLIDNKILKEYGYNSFSHLGRDKKTVGKKRVLKAIERRSEIEDTKKYDILKKIAESNLHIIRIKEIVKLKSKEKPVYDLHVPETQRFIGGNHPILLHNSEMFGDNPEYPFNEESVLKPASPYACAKVYAHNLVRNYREAYGLHVSSGILFNHECFYGNTPVILRENNEIDIRYVSSLINNRKDVSKDTTYSEKDYSQGDKEIWDGNTFVKLKTISRKKLNSLESKNQSRLITNTRNGSVETTPNHKLINVSGEKMPANSFKLGDKLLSGNYPENELKKECGTKFAKILGLLCGDGYVDGISSDYGRYLRSLLYDKRTKHKKVPKLILNSDIKVQQAFLDGYNMADGLKKDSTTYTYKSFKTNSPLLAQGLLYLINRVTKQDWNINPFIQNNKIYYQINLLSDNRVGEKGAHLKLPHNEIKKIIDKEEENQHVYDIETGTGRVMAGVGSMIVGNSPRRGETFVTRKISMAAAKIKLGLQDELYLGNLEAYRDWGSAKDYVEAMWLMLQQEVPDDYVISTGETHTVKEFLDEVFKHAGLDPAEYVKTDERLFRKHEVPYLLGDSSKAERILGWKPKTTFKALTKEMFEADYKKLKGD